MGFRKEMRENMKELFAKMDQLTNLYGNMEGLRDQNEALFDKLMARDWDEYSSTPTFVGRESEKPSMEIPISPMQDEAMAGEVLTDEEIVG